MNTATARPTLYKGTRMRSRLEAGFAAWLDRQGFTWTHEPHAFGAEGGQYLPDFYLSEIEWFGIGAGHAYIELKPAGWSRRVGPSTYQQMTRSLAIIADSDREAFLLYVEADAPGPVLIVPTRSGPSELPGVWVHGPVHIAIATYLDPASKPFAGDYWRVH